MVIAFQAEPHGVLPKAELVLTDPEIARRLGISEESARALMKAASQSLLITEKTKESTRPSSYPRVAER
jgi:hypothetical protein